MLQNDVKYIFQTRRLVKISMKYSESLIFVINWYTENGSGVEKSSDNNIMQYIK